MLIYVVVTTSILLSSRMSHWALKRLGKCLFRSTCESMLHTLFRLYNKHHARSLWAVCESTEVQDEMQQAAGLRCPGTHQGGHHDHYRWNQTINTFAVLLVYVKISVVTIIAIVWKWSAQLVVYLELSCVLFALRDVWCPLHCHGAMLFM